MSNPHKIALLTDSTADLTAQLRQGKPIYTVPLRILCADGEYHDGVDIFSEDIYRRLDAGEIHKTSLPDLPFLARTLDQIAADGYEKVIAVMLSSGLSGTFNMVRLYAAERSDLEIKVFDSLSGALGSGVTVLQLWEEICAGADWEYLVERRVPELIGNTFPFFTVDTLEYLAKGGRIGKVTAMAGTMLSIKPVIHFSQDGQLQSIAKVRGFRQAQDKLVELCRERLGSHRRYNLAIEHGGASEAMEQLREKLLSAFPDCEHCWESTIDATLSVYIGKGVIGAGIQVLD